MLDIDDTIIIPKSKTFRAAPYNQMIDRIKESKSNYNNYEEIVSNWILQRKVILIDEEWVEVLNNLKENYPVYRSYTDEYRRIRQYSFYARLAI
ncbi:MAG: hypothetical protein O7C58_09165 [Rickettsia endosymbiont of Ixodes persulcatus]|nr:hypothetical protein [Rickettsia endosymbiont of Ixodes persulcatus]MCZ6920090.1 hypothetical protein [Rickettsia endosymbiont of Ixodes persulcatus]MCZ6925709.1 hypothetical protein [Rickettsia endosymbiont of Ixodes persulcatus]